MSTANRNQNIFEETLGRLTENQTVNLKCDNSGIATTRQVLSGDCQLTRRNGSVFVRDLDSEGGTFVNSAEVRGFVEVESGDRLRFGTAEVTVFLPASGIAKAGVTETSVTGFALEVDNAVKTVRVRSDRRISEQKILDRVCFQVGSGEFIGVLGASGSGKSTLLKSLAGISPLSEGQIRLDTLAVSSEELKNQGRIAYLPQDVIVHQPLTPAVALDYVALLKHIGRDDSHRVQLIDAALERVGLSERKHVPIRRLSGGQRKRVALAAELLGEPRLILLDEATSGLDPATEAEMMQLFRSLAEEGRTILCITHFPGHLDTCDKLLFLMDGRCVFYGSPDALLVFFGIDDIDGVYTRHRDRPAEEWQALFQDMAEQSRPHVDVTRSSCVDTEIKQKPVEVRTLAAAFAEQTRLLTARYFRLQLADFKNLVLLFAQAPIIALMIAAAFGNIGVDFVELHAARTKEVVFLLTLSVLWCSGTASVREVVKEMPILRHETRFGVQLLPYLTSKMILLGMISLTQTLLLLTIVRSLTGLSGPFAGQFAVLAATGLTGVALGLLVSAVAGTSERAMTVLPVLLIGQAIFSGGLARIVGVVKALAMLLNPAWWSLDGIRSTFATELIHATYPGAPGHFQPPIMGSGGPILVDLLALIAQTIVLVALTRAALGRSLRRGPASTG